MDESSTRDYERKLKNCWRNRADRGLANAAGAGCAQVVLEALYVRSEGLRWSKLSYVRCTRVLRETTRDYERKAHNCVGAPGQTGGLTKAAGAGRAQATLGSPLSVVGGVAQVRALVREMDESSTRDYERKAHNFVGATGQTGGLATAAGAGRGQAASEALCLRSEGLHRSERSCERWTRVLRAFTRERRKNSLVMVTK